MKNAIITSERSIQEQLIKNDSFSSVETSNYVYVDGHTYKIDIDSEGNKSVNLPSSVSEIKTLEEGLSPIGRFRLAIVSETTTGQRITFTISAFANDSNGTTSYGWSGGVQNTTPIL
ncbi:hypothetical protein [Streptococcus hyointestinalis]|uniref:hypothetical protein n=1 Tax=Streptococcus hyointestinalis TaxID=1337 RepID=UPI0024060153|nr:hypothetical protein [Streptococcus hyointestinalis]